jgi:hypothetical protein
MDDDYRVVTGCDAAISDTTQTGSLLRTITVTSFLFSRRSSSAHVPLDCYELLQSHLPGSDHFDRHSTTMRSRSI